MSALWPLLLVLAAPPDEATSPTPVTAVRFARPAPTRTTLKSGAELAVVPRSAVPWTSFRLVVPLGSTFDPPGKSGLARATALVIESALLASPASEEPRLFARWGASLAVETTPSGTAVIGEVDDAHLDLTLALVTRRLAELEITPEAVRHAVGRAVAERQAVGADPRALAKIELRRSIFGAQPAARDPRGAVEELATITANDVRAAWQKQLRVGSVLLALTATTSAAQLRDRAERWLDALPKGRAASAGADKPFAAPPRARRIVVVDQPGLEDAVILAGKLAPSSSDPEHPAALAASTAIAGGRSAELAKRLAGVVAPEGAPSSTLETRAGRGLFTLELLAEPTQVSRTLALLFAELARIRADGVAADALDYGRHHARGRLQLELADPRTMLAAAIRATGPDAARLDVAGVRDAELTIWTKRLADPDDLTVIVVASATPALQKELAGLPGVRDVSIVSGP